ncbi:hypothetical protein [Arthrobacter castelli]|uniref:hypothetical protein n=1 Tax=Arthrobacter castelli TaxID=271431 RepID=UPI00040D575F|nr:hypothetical protein [Arthrobacter castelli]
MTGGKNHSRRGGTRHPAWSWQTLTGSLLMLASLFMLIPGINKYSAAVYTDVGASAELGIFLMSAGGAVLLCAITLLLIGYLKYRTYMNRPRTHEDRHDDHTIESEDRPENPYDMPGRGFQTGIF